MGGIDPVAYATVIGVIVGAAANYLIGRRLNSGQIATTNADRLWAQNEKLLEAYQTDNGHLRERLTLQDARMASQDSKIWEITKRERECAETSSAQASKIERLERMLKVDLGTSTEAEFGPGGK